MLKSKISFAVFLGKNIYSWALGAVKQISLSVSDDAKIQNPDGKKENFTKIFSHNCGSSEIPRQRCVRGKRRHLRPRPGQVTPLAKKTVNGSM